MTVKCKPWQILRVHRFVKCLSLLLLGSGLWLNAQAVYAEQSKGATETVTVWGYSLYTPAVTNHIMQPFFDELASRTDYHYHLAGDRQVSELMLSCREQRPDIIIASQSLGDQIQSGCDYRVIAVSLQNIQLFRKKTTAESIELPLKRVGVLSNIKATDIAYKELPDRYGEMTYVVYDDVFQLIKRYRSDSLDAIALPELFIKVAPSFAKNWTPHYAFKQKGVAVVLVSTSLDPSLTKTLQATFLNEAELTRHVWQQKIGLGKFMHPDSFQLADKKNY